MNKLLTYYQKELSFLKHNGKLFSKKFPKIARRLGMTEGSSEDPHVSRLIESFALLTSRIHQRLDYDMPEVIEALISKLAPQFLRTLPSVSIVMVKLDPKESGLTCKSELKQGVPIFTKQDTGHVCQFQTVYPINLLPLNINNVELFYNSSELNWQLKLHFQVWHNAYLDGECLRLYLNGSASTVNVIYTLLFSQIKALFLYLDGIKIELPIDAVIPVGFKPEDALISKAPSISPVHILLLDYFWFQQKFWFVDIQLPTDLKIISGCKFEISILFNTTPFTEQLEHLFTEINKDFFRLNCTPAINLFPLRADPIILTDSSSEYPITPMSHNQSQIDVWSIQKVSVQRKTSHNVEYLPILPLSERFSHTLVDNNSRLYWQALYHEICHHHGVEYKKFIAFSKHAEYQEPEKPDVISIDLLCSNNHLPNQLKYGITEGDFDSDIPLAGVKILTLTHPTQPALPPEKSEIYWRFLSLLSLNYQLLCDEDGVERLKDIFTLYNFNQKTGGRSLYKLIKLLNSEPITARLDRTNPHSVARGINVTVTFCKDAQLEPEYYLFCCMLDNMLALYSPVNSFIRLTTCIEYDDRSHKVWPIRAGKLSWL
ncbi:type VI secretion system baseplate subunit TssF [Providencia rettgeri]|uniref:type VI secretion system baseplate subunit TssF n=1 Tax=Providencia rettgeri TaxID=587 RepID=UPI00141A2456|nr:type VI secretion system baseplate subunit TssF [Providencia rettgeri]NIH07163.1 type VI secretion system baseplate subunit TssF [Providencia rettgeri]